MTDDPIRVEEENRKLEDTVRERTKELQEEKGSLVSSVELSWREKLDCSTFQTSKFLFALDYLLSKYNLETIGRNRWSLT